MSLLGLPAEIIENIVSYLSISDIRNLKLSCYYICEKIGDYSIDIGALIRYSLECLITNHVRSMVLRYGVINFLGDFMLKYTKYDRILYVYIYGSDKNKKDKGNQLIGLDFKFFGYDNMLEENHIYIKNISEVNNEKDIYDTLKDICYKMDIYFCGIIRDVIKYIEDDYFTCNIKNYEKIAKQDKILLLDYIKKNVIKY